MVSVLDFFELEDFKEKFWIAAIAARTCYNSKPLEELIKDERVSDPKERAEFLKRIASKKHFSVFGHSVAYKKLSIDDVLKFDHEYFKIITLKKVFSDKKDEVITKLVYRKYLDDYESIIGISLRHYLEEYYRTYGNFNGLFEKIAKFNETPKILLQKEHVALLDVEKDAFGYLVFFVDNVSRVMTHQLVRHTLLNYSQRSQRYISEDNNYTIIPPSIRESSDVLKSFLYLDHLSRKGYDLMLNQRIKKEDARFILPHGSRTTIVVSGPLYGIVDFIKKRRIPQAQWEIRNVAEEMRDILHEIKNQYPLLQEYLEKMDV